MHSSTLIFSLPSIMAMMPPVDVPPMRSKQSHGFGGFSGLMFSMSWRRIIRDESPRMPPPSSERSLNPLATAPSGSGVEGLGIGWFKLSISM